MRRVVRILLRETSMLQFRIFGTPVSVARKVFAELVALWAGFTWWGRRRHPGRGIWRASLVGLATLIVLVPVDLGHALAHIFSARYAGAPMDEVRLSGGMPRTLYRNNDVSPDVHRMRALGGLVLNLLGFLASSATYLAVRPRSLARELATTSAVGHALLFVMSLVPVPIVDGGTLMKWTLVAHGRTETEADETVRRVNWAMALVVGISGVPLIAMRKWAAGGILVGCAALLGAIAEGKIR
jgi:hypothetical protein